MASSVKEKKTRLRFEVITGEEAEEILRKAEEAYKRWHDRVLLAYRARVVYNEGKYEMAAQIMLTAFEPERIAVTKDVFDKSITRNIRVGGKIKSVEEFIAEHRNRCSPKTRRQIKSAEETLEGGKRVYEESLIFWKKGRYKRAARMMLRYFNAVNLTEVAEAVEGVIGDLNRFMRGLKAEIRKLGIEIRDEIAKGSSAEREQLYILWQDLVKKIRKARLAYRNSRYVQSADSMLEIEWEIEHLKDMIRDQLIMGEISTKAERAVNSAIKALMNALSRVELAKYHDKKTVARYIWDFLTPKKEEVIEYGVNTIMAEFKHDIRRLRSEIEKYRIAA